MGTQSLDVDVDDDLLRPRTNTPRADAPKEGIHLFHGPKSLCSQKVREFLDEKGVASVHGLDAWTTGIECEAPRSPPRTRAFGRAIA